MKQFPYTLNFPQKSEKTYNLAYSKTAFRVYRALEHFLKMGECIPSRETLGRYVKKSERTIQRALDELREGGAVTSRQRSNTSSHYDLHGLKSGTPVVLKSGTPVQFVTGRNFIKMRMEVALRCKISGTPDGTPDGTPSLYTYPNSLPHQNLSEKGSSNVPAMPKFYKSHDDQRLYYLAYRWAKEVGVKLYPSEVAKAMQELEEAGALEMSEEQPLPEIRWRPARPNGPRASEQPERKPQQVADYFSSDIAALKKVMGGE